MERITFLGRPPPDGFRRRLTVVPAGASIPYEASHWAGALVVVERGEIDLEGLSGSRCRFVAGDILWLAGLPLRSLCNRGPVDALLAAVSRASDAADGGVELEPGVGVVERLPEELA